MSRVLVTIRDSEDRCYDQHVLAPEDMDPETAANVVGDAIRSIQSADDCEYDFDVLIKDLEHRGFIFPETIFASEDW